MRPLTVGVIQANLRSSFAETNPRVARIADRVPAMAVADFEHNRAIFASLVREAAAAGAELVFGPESYVDGWSFDLALLPRIAESVPGPETERLVELARSAKVWLCVGLFERAGGHIYNSAVLISNDGELRGVYRKTHETPGVLARMPYRLGDRLDVFETPWGRTGILICHDRWYPENARTLRLRGAEFVLNPTATAVFEPGHDYHGVHDAVLRSHAYLNELFWVSCNAANHGGHSLVIAPDGGIIARASAAQEVVLVRLAKPEKPGFGFTSNLREKLYAIPS